ncbi:hypothetical protein ACFXPY_40375 [Streptomyces sp. NPDC059153]|uniref:hypothetical protein n=1 Tax=Streptomyces sp. NPDC059153 TaxID=3346743 RepID=UPI00368FC395
MPKIPLALGGLIGLLTAAAPALLHAGLGLPNVAMLSRVAAVTVALGASFALDDPAARTTVVVPVSPVVQRAVRAVPVFAIGLTMWAVAAATARLALAQETRPLFPWGGLAMEAAALVAISLALAALGLRFTEGEHGSMVAAPGILLLVITAALLPERTALFLPPGHPYWAAAHQVWAGLLVVGLTAGTLLARDTARRRFKRPPQSN